MISFIFEQGWIFAGNQPRFRPPATAFSGMAEAVASCQALRLILRTSVTRCLGRPSPSRQRPLYDGKFFRLQCWQRPAAVWSRAESRSLRLLLCREDDGANVRCASARPVGIRCVVEVGREDYPQRFGGSLSRVSVMSWGCHWEMPPRGCSLRSPRRDCRRSQTRSAPAGGREDAVASPGWAQWHHQT